MDYAALTAPCGRDCFNCPFFLARDDQRLRTALAQRVGLAPAEVPCAGCRANAGHCHVLGAYGFGADCAIHACSRMKQVEFCYQCEDFPCDRLHPLADRAGQLPHNLKIFNLCLIRKLGLQRWAEEQAKRSFERYYRDKLETCING
jgi:hypothetical protein